MGVVLPRASVAQLATSPRHYDAQAYSAVRLQHRHEFPQFSSRPLIPAALRRSESVLDGLMSSIDVTGVKEHSGSLGMGKGVVRVESEASFRSTAGHLRGCQP